MTEKKEEEFPYPSFGANNIIGSKFTDMAHDGIISKDEITDLGDIIFGKKREESVKIRVLFIM